jgi:hypothetical protein
MKQLHSKGKNPPDRVNIQKENLCPKKRKMPPAMRSTDFMLILQKRLIEERKVAETTSIQYLQTLYKLNGSTPFNTLAWTKKKEDVQKVIDTYSPSTQESQYSILTASLSLFNDKPTYKGTYVYWRTKMMDCKKNKGDDNREKNEKQQENWIAWEDVLEIHDTLRKDIEAFAGNKTLTGLQYEKLFQYMLASLYTDIPPRRNDYLDMYVVKKWDDKMDQNKNYYDLATQKMIFNKYKTAKKYGTQTVDVPENLQATLTLFLKHHPHAKQKNANDYKLLVNSDGSEMTSVNAITRALHKIFGKGVGSSMLRHSYLSAKYGDAIEDLEEDTTAMGNSPNVAIAEYIKK